MLLVHVLLVLSVTDSVSSSDFFGSFDNDPTTLSDDLTDIQLISYQADESLNLEQSQRLTARNALRDSAMLWPNGRIPFEIDVNYPAYEKIELLSAMQQIELSTYSNHKTCIMFIPRTTEQDYLSISWSSNVSHSLNVGYRSGRHNLSLSPSGNLAESNRRTQILWKLVTITGLLSEVNRVDRDKYLNVNVSNFAGWSGVFNDSRISEFNLPFDYESIVLPGVYDDSKNILYPAMSAINDRAVMGFSVALTKGDISLIQQAYNCTLDTTSANDILGTLPIECHFHDDVCTFVDDQSADFNWVLQSGSTLTPGTGPNSDMSSGSGKYASATAAGHHNQTARLISQRIPPGKYCFRTYFHMFGKDAGRLRVYITSANGDYALVFRNDGSIPVPAWAFFHKGIDTTKSFFIEIEATMGNGDLGDIAIDDIYLYRGRCIEW